MAEGPSQDGNLSPLQRDIAHGAAAGASTEVAQVCDVSILQVIFC